MPLFLPIAILAYGLGATTIIIDKILLRSTVPNPLTYAFYISVLGLSAICLLPFGIILDTTAIFFAIFSSILFVFALISFFQALKLGEASVVQPVVGALNPTFSLLIGFLFLNHLVSQTQFMAFLIIIFGSFILTYNLWLGKITFNKQLFYMIMAGVFFGLSYVCIREAFLHSNFLTGLTFSRISGGMFVLSFLLFPKFRNQIFSNKLRRHNFINKTSLLLIGGQTISAVAGLLNNFAVSLTNPALVNSLFGVQYLVILATAIFFAHEHRSKLLDENLTKGAIIQKSIGAFVLSMGVYLLSK